MAVILPLINDFINQVKQQQMHERPIKWQSTIPCNNFDASYISATNLAMEARFT
jgi:hypothetical protein